MKEYLINKISPKGYITKKHEKHWFRQSRNCGKVFVYSIVCWEGFRMRRIRPSVCGPVPIFCRSAKQPQRKLLAFMLNSVKPWSMTCGLRLNRLDIMTYNKKPCSFIFIPTFPLTRVARAAVLWVLEIPHGFQQSLIVLLALVYTKTVPSKVGDVIRHLIFGRTLDRFPVGLASRTCLSHLSLGILMTWPNHRSGDLSLRRKSGSAFRALRIWPLRTLSRSVTPWNFRKKSCLCRL